MTLNKNKIIAKEKIDHSIIDITEELPELITDINSSKTITDQNVPTWNKQHIYSNSEINSATTEQIKFYAFFKDNFFKNNIIPLEGNDNYAFTLYFDLLDEYKKHNDIYLLEKQFELLGECCPKTNSHSLLSLIDLAKEKGNFPLLSKLTELQNLRNGYNQNFSTSDSYEGKLQNKEMTLNNNKIITEEKIDHSIIDVTEKLPELITDIDNSKPIKDQNVPTWNKQYIYSNSEIKYASDEQIIFYEYFKENFLKENIVPLENNDNYAFILYFDLLDEFETHNDIELLEKQLKLLGGCCPKTKNYSLSSLIELLKKKGDSYSLSRLKDLQNPRYQYEHKFSNYDPDEGKLGRQYGGKLSLRKQEVAWLNKFWYSSNTFTSIEGCCLALIKQYLLVLNQFNKLLKKKNSSLVKEMTFFKEQIKKNYKKEYGTVFRNYNMNSLNNETEAKIYSTIFKRVENSVRNTYGHKRKISATFNCNTESIISEFDIRIGGIIDKVIDQLKTKIEKPDTSTQVDLNKQNTTRWKIEFNKIKDAFDSNNVAIFKSKIATLSSVNNKNSIVKNIYFESSKFIAKYDNVLALQYYIIYIYHNMDSANKPCNQLSKTIKKSIFKTNQISIDFNVIIDELKNDLNLEKALIAVSQILIHKRKKIVLDKNKIEEVEINHAGTVQLLGEYLNNNNTTNTNLASDPVLNSIKNNFKTKNESTFKPNLNMNNIQGFLLKQIAENSFMISQKKIADYALKNGMFKNQLIDSINDVCCELLDGEALIEEDEENYIIEKTYYNKIILMEQKKDEQY